MCLTSHSSSKSYTDFLTNSFIVLLVLIILPFIPSQPPQFIKQTIFTTFWELIYLFVIGIVVCYGLFSRRNGSKVESVTYPTSNISPSYFSGISHVSSFFENGVGNLYGYDEKKMTQIWGFGERFDFDEFNDSRSSRLCNGVGKFNGVSEKNEEKDWNSKCFVGKIGKYEVKPESRYGYKPLNLPVRSLKSRMVDTASNHEDTISKASNKINKVNFRGLVPINLDDKFKETVVLSPVPWGSRSKRMNLKDNVGKPAFVGETELVCPELPTVKHVSPALPISEREEFEKKGSLRLSFPPASKSSLARLKIITSSSRSSSRRFSTEVAVEKNTETNLKGFSEGEKEDFLNWERKGVVSLISDVKAATLVKGRAVSGSFSETTLETNFKEDIKNLGKDQKEDSLRRQNKCIEFSNLDVKHAPYVEGQLQVGLSSERSCKKSSENNLKGFDKSEKGDLLENVNEGNDFWNLDINTATLVSEQFRGVPSSEINVEKNSEIVSMGSRDCKKEDLQSGENRDLDYSKPDVKPRTTVKGLTRGKSVRTIRSNDISVGLKRSEEVYISHTGDKVIKNIDEDKAGFLKKSDRRADLESVADERNIKNIDKISNTSFSKLRTNRNGERQKNGSSGLGTSEGIYKESENFQVNADKEENRPCNTDDTHSESYEVDKKASEFIAKFREQIRLQRVASMRDSNFQHEEMGLQKWSHR